VLRDVVEDHLAAPTVSRKIFFEKGVCLRAVRHRNFRIRQHRTETGLGPSAATGTSGRGIDPHGFVSGPGIADQPSTVGQQFEQPRHPWTADDFHCQRRSRVADHCSNIADRIGVVDVDHVGPGSCELGER
jgi:hypothetical protein